MQQDNKISSSICPFILLIPGNSKSGEKKCLDAPTEAPLLALLSSLPPVLHCRIHADSPTAGIPSLPSAALPPLSFASLFPSLPLFLPSP